MAMTATIGSPLGASLKEVRTVVNKRSYLRASTEGQSEGRALLRFSLTIDLFLGHGIPH